MLWVGCLIQLCMCCVAPIRVLLSYLSPLRTLRLKAVSDNPFSVYDQFTAHSIFCKEEEKEKSKCPSFDLHRISCVGRDHKDHLVQLPCTGQGHLLHDQIAQNPIQGDNFQKVKDKCVIYVQVN